MFQSLGHNFSEVILKKIYNCSERAQAKMHVDANSFEPEHELLDINDKPIRLKDHWKDLSYVIGPQEMEGLMLFLNLVRELNV